MSPFFGVDQALRGLLNLRGRVIACFDISEFLGLDLRSLGESNRFVILRGGGAEMALCVDDVLNIRNLPAAGIQEADSIFSGEIRDYVSGIFESADGRVFILSVPRLFESERLLPYREAEE